MPVQSYYFLLQSNFFQLFIGLVTLFSPMWDNQTGLFVFSTSFGVLSGSNGILKAGVSRVLGKEIFSTSFSWFLFTEGIGVVLGPTIGGSFPNLKNMVFCCFLNCNIQMFLSNFTHLDT